MNVLYRDILCESQLKSLFTLTHLKHSFLTFIPTIILVLHARHIRMKNYVTIININVITFIFFLSVLSKSNTTKCFLIANYTNTVPLWLFITTIQGKAYEMYLQGELSGFLNCAFSNVSSLFQSGGGQIAGSGWWLTLEQPRGTVCVIASEMKYPTEKLMSSVCYAVNIYSAFPRVWCSPSTIEYDDLCIWWMSELINYRAIKESLSKPNTPNTKHLVDR